MINTHDFLFYLFTSEFTMIREIKNGKNYGNYLLAEYGEGFNLNSKITKDSLNNI